jgi:hypothetical protein
VRSCWVVGHRFDADARALADRHYNRQSPGAPQFAPPGRLLVLKTPSLDAFWVTCWPRFAQHAWLGAWICTAFRNEGPLLSSELIRDAVACTRAKFPCPPSLGMVTFVNPRKVRHKRDPGRRFLRAGFRRDGYTKSGLIALRLAPEDMPAPHFPAGGPLFDVEAGEPVEATRC